MGNAVGKYVTDEIMGGAREAAERLYRAQDSVWKRNIYASPDKVTDKYDDVETGIDNLDDVDADDVDDVSAGRESWQMVRKSRKCSTISAKTFADLEIDLKICDFPFENLVFQGGGMKGVAYIGGIQVMEELGILPKIRRFAGASTGAITACVLAIGCGSDELRRMPLTDFDKVISDHNCGYFSLLPNLIRRYGWNPGNRCLELLGDIFKKRNLHPDITFAQLYKARKVELCIVVTNVSLMSAEFFHPKTTPNFPIRKAVRMSISVPGIFQACQEETYGLKNIYVDGGILCNYPIRCFDGWWLSMKKDDRFMTRLQPDDDVQNMLERQVMFTATDPQEFEKTLGFLVFSDNEGVALRYAIEQRDQLDNVVAPMTTLKRENLLRNREQHKAWSEYMKYRRAINEFFKVLEKHNLDGDDAINKEELAKALSDEEKFPQRYRERIFGENVSVKEAFDALDTDGSGQIEFNELRHFAERSGVSIKTQILGDRRQDINGLISFLNSLQNTVVNNASGIFVKDLDVERSIGINTGHVSTTDFNLEDGDLDFLVQQGRRSTIAFLKWFVVEKHSPKKKTDFVNGKEKSVESTVKQHGDDICGDDNPF